MSETVRRTHLRSVNHAESRYYGSYTIEVEIYDMDKGHVVLHLDPYMAAHVIEKTREAMRSAQKDMERLMRRVDNLSEDF